MKILGIDYGTKRIGLAISDESETLARELDIISPQEFDRTLEKLIEDEHIEQIVLGLPLNMEGKDSQKTQEVRAFKDELETKFAIPIALIDERLSSAMALQLPGGTKNIDSLAA